MGKKKIDELFQEKFKDFEQLPDEKVWQNITASLEKKKKRAIPLWWKLGGVAALFVFSLFLINPFDDAKIETPTVTEVELNSNKDTLKLNQTKAAQETQYTSTDSQENGVKGTTQNEDPAAADLKAAPNSKVSKNKAYTVASQTEEKIKNQNSKTLNSYEKTQVVANESEQAKTLESISIPAKQESDALVLQNGSSSQERIEQKNQEKNEAENSGKEVRKNEKEALLTVSEDTRVAQNDTEENQKIDEDSTATKKKSIYDAIIEQEEKAIAENKRSNRWSAGPSIAPVYYDSFGEGSPVHSILVPNSKSGNTNLSYGLSVAYEINKRLSVRSGIHKVDYSYDTGEIEFSSSLDGSITNQMDNIDYAGTARNLVVKSKAGNTAVGVNNENNDSFDASTNSLARSGSMSQQFGYLEVPLELNYALIDKKIGVNLIGGFSSLFLIDNSISLSDGNQTTQMGEANNVNALNFSTNIGLGVDYNISSNLKLNVEPVFKYQLNTFNQVDGTFNPFSVGIYSGLTFRF